MRKKILLIMSAFLMLTACGRSKTDYYMPSLKDDTEKKAESQITTEATTTEAATEATTEVSDTVERYTAYFNKVKEYQNQYGTICRQDGYGEITGLSFVKLVDFAHSGKEQLVLVYSVEDSLYHEYKVEVWDYVSGNANCILTTDLIGVCRPFELGLIEIDGQTKMLASVEEAKEMQEAGDYGDCIVHCYEYIDGTMRECDYPSDGVRTGYSMEEQGQDIDVRTTVSVHETLDEKHHTMDILANTAGGQYDVNDTEIYKKYLLPRTIFEDFAGDAFGFAKVYINSDDIPEVLCYETQPCDDPSVNTLTIYCNEILSVNRYGELLVVKGIFESGRYMEKGGSFLGTTYPGSSFDRGYLIELKDENIFFDGYYDGYNGSYSYYDLSAMYTGPVEYFGNAIDEGTYRNMESQIFNRETSKSMGLDENTGRSARELFY